MITIEKFDHLRKLLINTEVDFLPMEFIHGLLTAAAIGPNIVPPSKWLPKVFFQEKMPEFKSLEQTHLVVSTLLNMYNQNLADIRNDEFGPLLEAKIDENGQEILNAEMWCDGFILGTAEWDIDWDDVDDHVSESMILLMSLTSGSALKKKKSNKKQKAAFAELEQKLINEIPECVFTIHDHWFENMDQNNFARQRVADNYSKHMPRIGRNDPCPCKSGKKFKKCCGAK